MPHWPPQLGGDAAPRRDGTLFWGDTRAPRQPRKDAFVCPEGKGLMPGGFWGAGVSPAGYTQAAPRTGDLTPLPWQRLVKSPGAGRLLQRGVLGWERGRQRRGPPAPLPAGPRNELWPRQRRRLRLTPVLPAVPVSPRPCHHARQGVPHLHAAHHRGGERGAAGTASPGGVRMEGLWWGSHTQSSARGSVPGLRGTR